MSNTCEACGRPIRVMAFRGTGRCCVDCAKRLEEQKRQQSLDNDELDLA